jgi:hypothetical protein
MTSSPDRETFCYCAPQPSTTTLLGGRRFAISRIPRQSTNLHSQPAVALGAQGTGIFLYVSLWEVASVVLAWCGSHRIRYTRIGWKTHG